MEIAKVNFFWNEIVDFEDFLVDCGKISQF